nr:DUF2946 family protein [Pantoea sp.]
MAMLLLFIAPEMSKTLEYARMANRDGHAAITSGARQPLSHDIDAPDGQTDMADEIKASAKRMHAALSPAARQQPASLSTLPAAAHGGIMNDAACGYCVMLIHLPLMLLISAALVRLTMRKIRTPPPRHILQKIIVYFSGIAQPRAPPV